ncbi:MAG: MgtC/SapB family protein [Bacteroidetes bacterium]|nr:MgtC/SapB family protein [Bacteroidota bacterium]
MLPYEEIIERLLLSALLGSVIGLDRERLDWAAGLRTHMLVSVGSTVFMIASAFGFSDILGTPNVVLDPSRVAAQIVSGIGFLGAGTIIFRREVIRGLTTAASLWTVAAIGLSVGGGLYMAAISGTAIVLFILVGIKPIERKLFVNRRQQHYTLTIERKSITISQLEMLVEKAGLEMHNISIQQGDAPNKERIQLTLGRAGKEKFIRFSDELRENPGVLGISHDFPIV